MVDEASEVVSTNVFLPAAIVKYEVGMDAETNSMDLQLGMLHARLNSDRPGSCVSFCLCLESSCNNCIFYF